MAGEAIKFNAGINTAGFDSGAKHLQSVAASASGAISSSFGSIATKIAGIGAAFVGVNQAISGFRDALNMAGRLDDLSKTTGASAGELLLLEKAFVLAGSSADAVGPAIARLSRFIVEANEGGKTQVETLNKLGLSYAQLGNLTPTEQMRLLAQSIMALPTPAERTAAAMDIFGRSGSTLIPLFSNFSGELDKAQGYLGSLPGLLDKSAAAMADMDDDIAALGDKVNHFVAGLISGAAGADNFASALAKIDAAGIGADLGEQLRNAFAAPLETSKAIGYTLLTGAKEAGNALINAAIFAAQAFTKTVSAEDYAVGLGTRIKALLLEAVNSFNKALAYGVEYVFLRPLSTLPGIIGDPFRAALASLQDVQKTLQNISAENYKIFTNGGEQIKKAFDSALNSTEILSKDWLGVEQSAADAARHILTAQEKGSATIAQDFITARVESEKIAAALAKSNPFNPMASSMGQQQPFSLNSAPPPGIFGMNPASLPPIAAGGGGGGGGGGGSSRGGGGGGGAAQTPFQQLSSLARNFDPAAMRSIGQINDRLSRAQNRASQLAAMGLHGSAANMMERIEKQRQQQAQQALQRMGQPGAGSAGGATPGSPTPTTTPGGGAPIDPVTEIYNWLKDTFMREFQDRLPQTAMTT